MTDPTRGGRLRRGTRRPGWILMTVLLVLAIVASSALVFTNRVELLKLAVILALWAAVVAAFVSVIYRRQSDSDQAKVRDLKLVYDLQLEREISARREYELTVESHLRRELAAELSAQSADEVASLRAELAALRANLEYLFDADLSHRPAIETERTAGRVSSSRIDTEDDFVTVAPEPEAPETDESPIIDVPAEPHPPEHEWAAFVAEHGGAHRRAGEQEAAGRRRRAEDAAPPQWAPPPPQQAPQQPAPEPPPPPAPQAAPVAPEPQFPWLPPPPQQPAPQPPQRPEPAPAGGWQPVPAEGQYIPAGHPGSNWVSPNGTEDEYVGRRRAPEQPAPEQPQETPRGKHYAPGEQSAPEPQPAPQPRDEEAPEPEDEGGGAHTGGQSVAELLARLQATPSGGSRRRRRED